MKSQRRHELQTNELADLLGKYVKAAAPYQNLIMFGGLALVALAVAAVYFINQNRMAAAAGWTDYFSAVPSGDPESLVEVAQIHGDSDAAQWSRLTAGDINLATGASMRLSDKKESQRKLRDAAKDYEAVLDTAPSGSMLRERARFGLAQAHESLCELDEAQELYAEIAQANPDTELGQFAKQRSEELGRKSVKRWYAWFKRQEPQPPPPLEGMGELPDVSTGLDPSTEAEDIALPDPGDAPEQGGPPKLVAPDTEDASEPFDEPVESDAAEGKPADAEPADAKPADAEPADAEPADAEPADAKPAEAEKAPPAAGAEGEPAEPQQ